MSTDVLTKPKGLKHCIAEMEIGETVVFDNAYPYGSVKATISGKIKELYPDRVFKTQKDKDNNTVSVTRQEDKAA